MAVSGGLFENRATQIQRFNNALRRQFKNLAHGFDKPLIFDGAGSEGVNHDRNRLRDADSIRKLHFATLRDACGHEVFRHIPRHVRR